MESNHEYCHRYHLVYFIAYRGTRIHRRTGAIMNSQTALNTFDSALAIMSAAAKLETRANTLTWNCSAFNTFEKLINAEGGYRPSLSRANPECRELGALYDATQQARGDHRRAFMYGTPKRKGSIIDRRNWKALDYWYRQGDRIAWYDRNIRAWTLYSVEPGTDYQRGAAEYYPNMDALLMGECAHA
jgi:hypothetical protein